MNILNIVLLLFEFVAINGNLIKILDCDSYSGSDNEQVIRFR